MHCIVKLRMRPTGPEEPRGWRRLGSRSRRLSRGLQYANEVFDSTLRVTVQGFAMLRPASGGISEAISKTAIPSFPCQPPPLGEPSGKNAYNHLTLLWISRGSTAWVDFKKTSKKQRRLQEYFSCVPFLMYYFSCMVLLCIDFPSDVYCS